MLPGSGLPVSIWGKMYKTAQWQWAMCILPGVSPAPTLACFFSPFTRREKQKNLFLSFWNKKGLDKSELWTRVNSPRPAWNITDPSQRNLAFTLPVALLTKQTEEEKHVFATVKTHSNFHSSVFSKLLNTGNRQFRANTRQFQSGRPNVCFYLRTALPYSIRSSFKCDGGRSKSPLWT